MDVSFYISSNQEYFTTDLSMITDDSVDEYLEDPNLSVSDMINKYNVSMPNGKEKKERKDLRCAVCNAQAFGFNFDQISCESCKAFFRRNALKDMSELHCRFSGACKVTVETRRHCSFCRIKKCFAVGMKKQYIRSEEEKEKKRGQSEKSRRRKYPHQTDETLALMQIECSSYPKTLSLLDRIRLNNITNCYNQFTGEPGLPPSSGTPKVLSLRVDEFYNRKKIVFINLISYFKHLPELQTLDVDDQVSLIKQNIRLLLPLNYAILKTPVFSKRPSVTIQTVGCMNNANLHQMLRSLADTYVECVIEDPMLMKLFLVVLFFTTSSLTTRSIYDPAQYKQLDNIKQIQSSYIELLWLYLLEKCGDEHAIHVFTKMITKYLHVQITIDQIDSIIRMNNDIKNIDALMQTVLQLT